MADIVSNQSGSIVGAPVVIEKGNANLSWFQTAVSSCYYGGDHSCVCEENQCADGYFDVEFLDEKGNAIPLVRQAQVFFTAVQEETWVCSQLGQQTSFHWLSFNGKNPRDGRVSNMRFTGATVTDETIAAEEVFTVTVENINAPDGGLDWRYIAVNLGDQINLNEYFLKEGSLSVTVDDTPVTGNIPYVLATDYRDIVIFNYWWDDDGAIVWNKIPKAENSIEISFALEKYDYDDEDFGFEIIYISDGEQTTITGAPVKYNPNRTLVLPIPTKQGYTFGGWYTQHTNGSFAPTSKISTTAGQIGTLTVYARWFSDTAAGPRYDVDTAEVLAGQIFTIDVEIKGIEGGVSALRNAIVYDNNVLELIGFTPRFGGSLTRAGVATSPNNMLWDGTRNTDGTFATLSFRARCTAPEGEYVIAVNPGDAAVAVSGAMPQRVQFTGGAGTVTIEANNNPFRTGDINGDGEIGMVDLLLLRLHLAYIITLEGRSFAAADIDKDGLVDILDLVALRQYIVGDLILS
jgi:uncharacterized repeat protein (TIGR02543 family)